MKHLPIVLAATIFAAPAGNAAEVELWRLDCGRIAFHDLSMFSDIFAYQGRSQMLTNSCYLIRHDADYMLWDTGLPGAMAGQPPMSPPGFPATLSLERTIADQLAEIGVTPDQVGRLGISHAHFDHMGQAAGYPHATLMIGAADLEGLKAAEPPFSFDPSLADPWLTGGAVADPVAGDRDIWGDGTVTMLAMPGHTGGETALLVRLAETGPVLLSGDVAHFHEQIDRHSVPAFNADRAETLASMDRLTGIAEALGARLVIQHDAEDVSLLPAFPGSAR